MKVWIEHGVIRGLGQKTMVIMPVNDGSLLISVPYDNDNDRVYFGHMFAGDERSPNRPTTDDGFKEIILPDFLAEQLYADYIDQKGIDRETSEHLKELVMAHKNATPKTNVMASVQQTLEQIRQNDL